MSRIEVSIMGQGYVLGSPDGEDEALRAAAARVDQAMCKVRDAGKIKARDRIAVLASLNLAFDLIQAQSKLASPAAAALATGDSASADDAVAEQTLRHLVSRLDQALQDDGRLL